MASLAKFYELFAGIGLVREALEPLGCECIYTNDFDKSKKAIYQARFPEHQHFDERDLWDVEAAELPKPVDLIAASFPCIDLSLAGKRGGLYGRHSGAFWAFVRILTQLCESGESPGGLLIENVTGFISSNGGEDFRTAVQVLNGLGYRIDTVQVTAQNFLPQSRPRLFVLGLREDIAPRAMVLPEQSASEWKQTVCGNPEIRSRPIRELMLSSTPSLQSSFFDAEAEEQLSWGAVIFPELPQRSQSFADLVEWEHEHWWSQGQTEKALREMAPLHQARITDMLEKDGRQAATAYRRRRNGKSVYEVRSDGIAGCLRTARGGSSKQIVIVTENGRVRMRWMSPREYAWLQGGCYPEVLDQFGDVALRTAYGDAVCVPAVQWIAKHTFSELLVKSKPIEEHMIEG